MAICPNLTKILLDENLVLTTGAGVHSKGNYNIEIIGAKAAIIWMDCIGANCQWWDSTHNNCSVPVLNLFNYHKHDSHEHVDAHTVGEIPADPGAPIALPAQQSYASLLSQEYMMSQDTDGNNDIFGIDFALDIYDTNVPKMLLTILKSPDFPSGLDIWTWQNYLDSLP